MVIGALGFVRRPSEWILDIVWLFACAVFALVVVRFSEFFRSHGEPSTGPAGNARRFAAALTGATLALFTGYAAVYFGRLDMTFDDFSYVVAFLTVPAVLLVLYGWPRLYRPLVRTPARAAGSFILILSVVVGQGYAIETVARASDCDPLSRSNYPTRMAPACGPIWERVTIHRRLPTVLSTDQPVAPRKERTWNGAFGPPTTYQAAPPTNATAANEAIERQARLIRRTGSNTIAQSFAKIANPKATPASAPSRLPLVSSAIAHTAKATDTGSNRW